MTMRARVAFASALALATSVTSTATLAHAEDPFEPAPRGTRTPAAEPAHHDGFRPVTDVLLAIVRYYQRDVGAHSVSRCPFAVSCSQHAVIALEKYGLFGLPLFLDRYFFRENGDAYSHYRLVRMNDGSLRLDDAAFDLE